MTRLADGETRAGWGVIARSSQGGIDVMFGQVKTTEAHLAFACARVYSNNTTELTAMVQTLSFLGPVTQLPVMHILAYDSKQAAGVCLGTIEARTKVQLGLS